MKLETAMGMKVVLKQEIREIVKELNKRSNEYSFKVMMKNKIKLIQRAKVGLHKIETSFTMVSLEMLWYNCKGHLHLLNKRGPDYVVNREELTIEDLELTDVEKEWASISGTEAEIQQDLNEIDLLRGEIRAAMMLKRMDTK